MFPSMTYNRFASNSILTRREEINRVEKEEPDPSYLRVAHVCVRVACKHAVRYSSPYSPLTKRAIEEARVIVVFSDSDDDEGGGE